MCHDPIETEELLSNIIQFELRGVYLLASMHGPGLIMHIVWSVLYFLSILRIPWKKKIKAKTLPID